MPLNFTDWSFSMTFIFWCPLKLLTSVRLKPLMQISVVFLAVSLWKDVTLNLKLRDIEAATDAKHRLEEKQRAEARERKENEMQWETRVCDVLIF